MKVKRENNLFLIYPGSDEWHIALTVEQVDWLTDVLIAMFETSLSEATMEEREENKE